MEARVYVFAPAALFCGYSSSATLSASLQTDE
jgi:hypothetical protein